jgi:hypothetical protein
MLSDPAAAAWVAAGRPAVDAPEPVAGRCGRCGEDGPTVTSSRIVSWKFTGFDAWPFGSRRLCVPCAWAYSRSPAVVPAMMITTTTVTEHPKAVGLAAVLAAGALPATQAVILPSTRRRHILATAEWGHLATDGIVTAWDWVAASRLADLGMVRPAVAAWVRAQATKSMNGRRIALEIDRVLLREMPPYPLLAAQPREGWPQFLAAWTALQPWRAVAPLWVAARILVTASAPGAT